MTAEPMSVRTATIAGRALEYVDAGSGPVLVLVHGSGGSCAFWRQTITDLSTSMRVIVPSLPGHGGSARLPKAPTDLAPYADAIAELLDEVGVQSAVVLGHSLGGLVAQHFAFRHETRTEALVLVDSGGSAITRIRLTLVVSALRLASWLASRPRFVRAITTREGLRLRMLAHAVHDATVMTPEMIRDGLRDFAVPGVVDAIRAGAREQGTFSLGELSIPVTVIWGRHDRVLPLRIGEQLAMDIPRATLEVIDGSGHAPMVERPREFASAVRRAVFSSPRSQEGLQGPLGA
jgi:pimeloyl-ACP methyl ester carboxylesterase